MASTAKPANTGTALALTPSAAALVCVGEVVAWGATADVEDVAGWPVVWLVVLAPPVPVGCGVEVELKPRKWVVAFRTWVEKEDADEPTLGSVVGNRVVAVPVGVGDGAWRRRRATTEAEAAGRLCKPAASPAPAPAPGPSPPSPPMGGSCTWGPGAGAGAGVGMVVGAGAGGAGPAVGFEIEDVGFGMGFLCTMGARWE